MQPSITWYSLDEYLTSIEHCLIEKTAALAFIDDYFKKLKPHYSIGEESLAETLFGFQKSPQEFIEIILHSPSHISCRFEVATTKKLLFLRIPKVSQIEATLRSAAEVKNWVTAFYDLDTAAFSARTFTQNNDRK